MTHAPPSTTISHIIKLPDSFHKKLVHDCTRLFEVYPSYMIFTVIVPYTDGSSVVLKCSREGKIIKAEMWDNPKENATLT